MLAGVEWARSSRGKIGSLTSWAPSRRPPAHRMHASSASLLTWKTSTRGDCQSAEGQPARTKTAVVRPETYHVREGLAGGSAVDGTEQNPVNFDGLKCWRS